MSGEGRGRRPASTPGSRGTAHAAGRDGRRRRRSAAGAVPPARIDEPSSVDQPAAESVVPDPNPQDVAVARRRSGLTTRAIALGVVLLLLTISYASSLRVYFDQQRQAAALDAEITQRREHIDDLNTEIERWKDPNYVKAQARERLGWVVPGETGYRVVGPDGKPVVPGTEVAAETGPAEQNTWWQKLDGSLRTADGPTAAGTPPVVPPTQPTAPPKTIGPSEPTGSASKKR